MSDTNIKKKNNPESVKRGRAGGLTLRILSVNVLPLLVLVVGLLSLGQYRDSLIQENLKTLEERAQNFAIAIEGPEDQEALIAENARRTVRKLSKTKKDTRIRVFDRDGDLIADSHRLSGPTGVVDIMPLEEPDNSIGVSFVLAYLGTQMLKLLPTMDVLPPYQNSTSSIAKDYPDAERALTGSRSMNAWESADSGIILTAAAPIEKGARIDGAVLLTYDGRDIESGMDRVRFDVLTATLAALSITIFLSLYLAGIIGRPLKKLAIAAEAVRQGKGRQIDIPDLTHRKDEIGELSAALRDMTQALWDRMDTIESFAADVAHEIKNPLTSLRSAVETAAKVSDSEKREKLMAIIHHDVQRLDRLISDISNASRLDAELSRDEMGKVDLHKLLQQLVDAHLNPLDRGNADNIKQSSHIKLEIPANLNLDVRGNEGRLAQVFDNLIGNALSFSPKDGAVTVRALENKEQIIVKVEDDGPGVPENKLETIFERFYSERPQHEEYGKHSGLGLSIAKQIINAHRGQIFAENIVKNGDVQGARFTVILDKV